MSDGCARRLIRGGGRHHSSIGSRNFCTLDSVLQEDVLLVCLEIFNRSPRGVSPADQVLGPPLMSGSAK